MVDGEVSGRQHDQLSGFSVLGSPELVSSIQLTRPPPPGGISVSAKQLRSIVMYIQTLPHAALLFLDCSTLSPHPFPSLISD